MLSEAIRNTDIEDFVFLYYDDPLPLDSNRQKQLMGGSSSTSVRLPRSLPAAMEDSPYMGGGQPLLEVFSVRIHHTFETMSLYGIILVGSINARSIYDREEDNPENVQPGDPCTLTGPEFHCIEAEDCFTIYLDLKGPEGLFFNDGICWNIYDKGARIYDKVLQGTVVGLGSNVDGILATVSYKVLKKAVQSTVALVVVKTGQAASCACVRGEVTAYNGDDSPEDNRILFKNWEDPIEVDVGKEIPLLRSVMAVPASGSLIVRATVTDSKPSKRLRLKVSDIAVPDAKHSSSKAKVQDDVSDTELFSPKPQVQELVFGAKLSDTEEQNIFAGDSVVRVRVTWLDIDWQPHDYESGATWRDVGI